MKYKLRSGKWRKPLAQLSLMVAVGILLACNRTNSVSEQVLPNDPNAVTLDVARSAAQHLNITRFSGTSVRKGPSTESMFSTATVQRVMLDITPMPDKLNPSYFICNYTGGGWSIIAADRRVAPVLAHGEEGYFPHSGAQSDGLTNWLLITNLGIQAVKKSITYKAAKCIDLLWATAQGQSTEVIDSISARAGSHRGDATTQGKITPPPPCSNQPSVYTIGPVVSVQWGQAGTYNEDCPFGNYDDGHVPVGCVATAMSQIMSHFKKPVTYNWTSMPPNSGNTEVQRLVHNAGISVNMNYNDSGSGAFVTDIPNGFVNGFGYSRPQIDNYDQDIVTHDITLGYPVILSANASSTDGHAWVCDGFDQELYTPCDSPPYEYLMFHMNWGWNEHFNSVNTNGNGWYTSTSWIVQNGSIVENFSYNKQIVHNIHP